MNYGKSAYTKVLELERKFGNLSNGGVSGYAHIFETSEFQSFDIEKPGQIDLGFLSTTNDATVCFVINSTLVSNQDTQLSLELIAEGNVISTKTLHLKAGEPYQVELIKTYVPIYYSGFGVKLNFSAESKITVKNLSMIAINADSSQGNSIEDIELRSVKTPLGSYIISYAYAGNILACEVDISVSRELDFRVVAKGISHSFAFDKNNELYLFYVDKENQLYSKKVGSVFNDELLSLDAQKVCASGCPKNASGHIAVCFTHKKSLSMNYLVLGDSGRWGESISLAVPENEYCHISMASSENFMYLVLTTLSGFNYILKSAYEPLGAGLSDQIKFSYSLDANKYYTLGDISGELVDNLLTTYLINSFTYKNYESMIEDSGVSHLKAGYEFSHEAYQIESNVVYYKVIIDKSNPDYNTNVTYGEDAAGLEPMFMSANPSNGRFNVFNGNGWEEKWPFNQFRPCVLLNGKFVGYANKDNFKLFEDGTEIGSRADDNYYDVMIEFPKIYYKIETIDNFIHIHIANKKIDDSFVCYAHVYDGIELDKIYVAAYHGVTKTYNGVKTLFSSSGTFPDTTGNINFNTYEGYIQAKSPNYRFMNFDQITLLQCLFLLAFRSTNSHQSFARGVNTGSIKVNGTADDTGMFSGSLTELKPAKFCGIENIFGNIYTRIEGIFINSMTQSKTYTIYRRNPYSTVPVNKNGDGYEPMTNPTLDGVYYIYQFLVDPYGTTEHGFLPQRYVSNGSNSTYFCDHVDFCSHFGMFFGGDHVSGTGSGMFHFRSDPGKLTTGMALGYRLCYYPVE